MMFRYSYMSKVSDLSGGFLHLEFARNYQPAHCDLPIPCPLLFFFPPNVKKSHAQCTICPVRELHPLILDYYIVNEAAMKMTGAKNKRHRITFRQRRATARSYSASRQQEETKGPPLSRIHMLWRTAKREKISRGFLF